MAFVFFLSFVSHFPQEKIDEVIFKINRISKESYNVQQNFEKKVQSNLKSIFSLFDCKSHFNPLSDIIIGDTPGETLFVSGYFYNGGNIFIVNDGVLRLKNADFNLDGNIYVLNKGKVLVDSSYLKFLQDYIYQYGITLIDSAEFMLTNSNTRYNGFPFGFSTGGFSKVIIQNTTNYDWTTAMVSGWANVYLNNVGVTGEWLFSDYCFAHFKNVDNFLSWYFFPESSMVNIKFPDGAQVDRFFIDSTLGNIQGIGYHIEIDSSTNCMWAAIPLEGSNVMIDSSLLRVTGLLLGGSDSLTLSGLVNGLYYEDYTLPLSDRNFHLIHTTVQTWNIYPFDTISLELYSSIFGELCAYGNSYVYLHNAFCDDTGGHLESNDNAFLMAALSSISADIISNGHSICIIGYCAMPWGNIWCTGSSIMILLNSNFPIDPVPSDTSLVFVLSITGPNSGNTNDTIPIIGSAWIDKGQYQPLDFGFYQVFYQSVGDTNWIPVCDSGSNEIRRDTLCFWNTVGLDPGDYIIRLVLKDNAGDSVDCLKSIILYENGIYSSGEEAFSSLKITPKLCTDFIKVEGIDCEEISKFNCRIFDIDGRCIIERKIDGQIISTEELTSGIYFICIESGRQRMIEKFVRIR
ncbi:MAG: hypothetical protein ACPL28_11625 [bacterium]